MVDNDNDDGRRTDGRRLDAYTISSPCEPNGSGELKNFVEIESPSYKEHRTSGSGEEYF